MNTVFLEKFYLWIGHGFTAEVYLLATKIQGILWSTADIIFIYFLLKLADLARKKNNKKKIFYQYHLLWLSAIFVPFLIFTTTSKQFFRLESIIFGLQFSILIYTIFADIKGIMNYLRDIVVSH